MSAQIGMSLEVVAATLGKKGHHLRRDLPRMLNALGYADITPFFTEFEYGGKVKVSWVLPPEVVEELKMADEPGQVFRLNRELKAKLTALSAELAQYRAGGVVLSTLENTANVFDAPPNQVSTPLVTHATTPVQAPTTTPAQGFTQEQFRSAMFNMKSDLAYKVNDLFNFANDVLGLYYVCKADNLAYYTTSDLGTTALNMCGMAFSNIDFIDYKHTQDALSIVESIKELGRKGTGLQKPLVLSDSQESLFTELKQKLRYEPVGFNEALFELRQPELCEEDEPAPVQQSASGIGMESHPLFDGTFPVPHNLSEVDKMPYRSAFVSKAVELNDLEDLFDKCKRTYESVAKTAVRWAKPDAEVFASDVNLFTTLDRRRWTKFKVESNDPELVTTEQKAQLEGHIKLLLNDIRSRLQWAKTNCKDGVQFEVSPTVEEAMPIYLDGKPREITYYGDDIE